MADTERTAEQEENLQKQAAVLGMKCKLPNGFELDCYYRTMRLGPICEVKETEVHGNPGEKVAKPLIVSVWMQPMKDGSRLPLKDYPVRFEVVSGGGSIIAPGAVQSSISAEVRTEETGLARLDAWTLGHGHPNVLRWSAGAFSGTVKAAQ